MRSHLNQKSTHEPNPSPPLILVIVLSSFSYLPKVLTNGADTNAIGHFNVDTDSSGENIWPG